MKSGKAKKYIAILLSIVFLFSGCTHNRSRHTIHNNTTTIKKSEDNHLEKHDFQEEKEKQLEICFLDVGEADCQILQLPNGQNMIIDAGDKDDVEEIMEYLEDADIEYIDYAIATHPHADHIGAFPEILDNYNVGSFYMPDITINTTIFDDMIRGIYENDIPLIIAKEGIKIVDSPELSIEIIAPIKHEYDNINNYSAVIRLDYKDISFLFMGDAEKEVEDELADKINVDVIKIGHHGSNTSTSEEFLKKVSPICAIITSEENSKNGNPDLEVVERLGAVQKVFRTDKNGDITLLSDGVKLKAILEK